MIDALETNKPPLAAAGISVEARLQTAGEPSADGAFVSPYVHCLPDDRQSICGLPFEHALPSRSSGDVLY